MEEVFGSGKPVVILDLTVASDPIYQITEMSSVDFDRTLFLNGMLNFAANRYTSGIDTSRFLQDQLLKINQEYSLFANAIRREKMRALAATMVQFRELNHELTGLFQRHELYNASGILKIDTLDATDISCTVARLDNSKWTQDFSHKRSYSTSGISLEYLGQILLSV